MAENSPTVAIWASCTLELIPASGLYRFLNNDGGFARFVSNAFGDVSLFLRADHSLARDRATHAIAQLFVTSPIVPIPANFILEHVDQLEKRIRMTTSAGGFPIEQDFCLTLYRVLR